MFAKWDTTALQTKCVYSRTGWTEVADYRVKKSWRAEWESLAPGWKSTGEKGLSSEQGVKVWLVSFKSQTHFPVYTIPSCKNGNKIKIKINK